MRSAHGELYEGFRTPKPEFSPAPIWWWSGDTVELSRLCEQLDRLTDQGIFNVVPVNLAPTGPTAGALADRPALFSEAWWDLWAGLAAYARTRGVRLWFYDQIGFSGANLQGRLVTDEPEFAGAAIERVVCDTDGGGCELACPEIGTLVAACALPLDPAGTVTGPPVPVEVAAGRVRYDQPGRHRVMLAYHVPRGFDYLSPRACAALIDLVHGEFERRLGEFLGEVIVGSFQDELPSVPGWSRSFADEFAARRGYRIEPLVAALWEDWGPVARRVRADYQRVRAALAEEAFFVPLSRWHAEHAMVTGFDQQSPSRAGEPVACTQQYGDYLRTHRWYGAPGSDHWGDAKLHSSLAHHYGHRRTWIEAFHSSGWGGTLEETFDWLVPWLLAGATLYNPHAVYYSTRDGWWEWAAPSTCWRQPYWRHYRGFADTVSRLCWLLTQGGHVCDVGVLFPSATVQASTVHAGPLPDAVRAQRTYLAVVGRMAWFYTVPGGLAAAGRDYDVLDDDTVAGAAVADGALRTRGEAYRAVIVPSCRFLEAATAQRLAEFGEQGGLLVFVGDLPEATVEGDGGPARRLRELVTRGAAQHLPSADGLPSALSPLPRPVATDGKTLLRRHEDSWLLLVPSAATGSATAQPMLPWVGELPALGGGILDRYARDLRERGYDFDPRRYRDSAVVRIAGGATDIEQWDPLTGAVSRPETAAIDGGGVAVTVGFASAPVTVLVWRSGPVAAGSTTARSSAAWTERTLKGPWTSRVLTAGPVSQWRLGHRLEPAAGDDWRQVLVGHGTFAWRHGPVAPDQAPPPLADPNTRELAGPDWTPVRYSLSRGIEDDPLHAATFGPKGRVPEEFWQVDGVGAGQLVALRTTLPATGRRVATLAVAGNGAKQVWWNGQRLPDDPRGHVRLDPVVLEPGPNLLEVRVHAESDGPLRGYWALTTDPDAFTRPDWLMPADGAVPGTVVVARHTLVLPDRPRRVVLQLGTRGTATLRVGGRTVASQGGFDPYGENLRVLPYDATSYVDAGENLIEVVLADTGRPVSVLVDGVAELPDDCLTIATDASWSLSRDGVPVATDVARACPYDPRWSLRWPRPHPLPRATWLDGAPTTGVLDLIPDARPGRPRQAEWFRLVVPPGAVAARLPVVGRDIKAWLDGAALALDAGRAVLDGPERERRTITLRVVPCDGRTEGALWEEPPAFEVADGRLSAGDWAAAGLGSYSGGVSYTRTVRLDRTPTRAVLDLGAVRGTAEVAVNGVRAGARIWSPYRFDLSHALRAGDNVIRVDVFNTLAPALDDSSPTTMVFAGQRVSGLLGPVRLRYLI